MRLATLSIIRLSAAATLWGTAGCAGQMIGSSASPALSAAVRMLLGGAVLGLSAGQAQWTMSRRLPRTGLLAAALAMALFQWTLFRSLELGNAVAVTVISVAVAPWATRIAAALFPGLRGCPRTGTVPGFRAVTSLPASPNLTSTDAAVTAATFVSIALIAHGTALHPASLALAITSGLAYALYSAITATMERQVPGAALMTTAAALLAGGVLAAPLALTQASALLNLRTAALLAYLGIAPTALAYRFFLSGMRRLGPASALCALCLEPLAAVAASWIIFGTALNRWTAAALFILTAAMILQLSLNPTERKSS